MRAFTKDPEAVLDYAFDWTAWLQGGETISTATVTVEAGLTKASQNIAAGVVTCWLSGGTLDESYAVLCHIITSQGRQDDRTLVIRVGQR